MGFTGEDKAMLNIILLNAIKESMLACYNN